MIPIRMIRTALTLLVPTLAPMAALGLEDDSTRGLFIPATNATDQRSSLLDTDSQERPLLAESTPAELKSESELRSRLARVDFRRLEAARDEATQGDPVLLRLNLFDDVALEVVVDRTGDTRYGYSLSGRIRGQPHGGVTLVVNGNILAGSVHARQGHYVIASRNGAIHTIREVAADLKCGVDTRSDRAPLRLRPAKVAPGTKASSEATASDVDDGAEIDLLVLFTQAAFAVEGGLRRMLASIDLAVAFANDAYDASGVGTRLNLVAAVQINYKESNLHDRRGLFNQREDLNRLVDPTDGFMDDEHVLRDRYAADVVHLIVDQANGGGVAEFLRPNAEDPGAYAFSISNSLSEYPAFLAHEVGHVMGLRHDRYAHYSFSDLDESFPPYAHGYVNQRAFGTGAPQASRWRTIMAYNAQCHDEGFYCRESQRFSNPHHRYPNDDGDPLGVPGDEFTDATDGPADAVRHLNETRTLMSGFGQSATRCDYRLSEERREVAAAGGGFSVEVDGSCPWTANAFGDFLSVESGGAGSGSGSVRYLLEANDGAARVGYLVVAGETLSVYQSGRRAPASVCGRTPQVRDAIVSATDRNCEAVSEFDLLEVAALDLSNLGITALDAGDFTGLRYLTELRMNLNPQLSTIPERAFDDLVNLKTLVLEATGLTGVPGAIRGLRSLRWLDLSSSDIAELPGDAFRGLSELRNLLLHRNRLTTLPDGVFAPLRKLGYLYLYDNGITDVRKEALQGPTHLLGLDLSHNPLGELREDAFVNIPNVLQLFLDATQLEAVPSQTFADLTELGWLGLSDNRIKDLSGIALPGSSISWLHLANNALRELPAGVFAGFTSVACSARNMTLDLTGNPGSPFALTLELDRVDGGDAAAGPATVVVRVREGMPWPINVRVAAAGDSSFTTQATVPNGDVRSEPFEVAGDEPTLLRFAAEPRVPGSYKGVRIALADPLQLFALADRELSVGAGSLAIDLDEAMGKEGVSYAYKAESLDDGVATVRVENGTLIVDPAAEGSTAIFVTAMDSSGLSTTRTFRVTVEPTLVAPRSWWKLWMLEASRRLSEERQ